MRKSAGLPLLSGLPHLCDLSLSFRDVPTVSQLHASMSDLALLTGLHTLSLRVEGGAELDVSALSALERLSSLELSARPAKLKGLPVLARACKQLTTLKLAYREVVGEEEAAAAAGAGGGAAAAGVGAAGAGAAAGAAAAGAGGPGPSAAPQAVRDAAPRNGAAGPGATAAGGTGSGSAAGSPGSPPNHHRSPARGDGANAWWPALEVLHLNSPTQPGHLACLRLNRAQKLRELELFVVHLKYGSTASLPDAVQEMCEQLAQCAARAGPEPALGLGIGVRYVQLEFMG